MLCRSVNEPSGPAIDVSSVRTVVILSMPTDDFSNFHNADVVRAPETSLTRLTTDFTRFLSNQKADAVKPT